MKRIALISAPWPLFNRPSIQLGVLKSFVRQENPQVHIDSHHIYLAVAAALGYDLYRQISEKTWLSETPYAALLYPGRTATISKFWKKRSCGLTLSNSDGFAHLCSSLKKISASTLAREDWEQYLLAGFSICFGQLTSSLWFIHNIKKLAPSIKIVVGGSACAGQMGKNLLKTFPEIDFVIRGEGELPLVHLIKTLTNPHANTNVVPIPGLITRHKDTQESSVSQMPHLDDLPIPDYGDYFRHLKSLGPEKMFLPKIPMEISRGCWWRKGTGHEGASGCAFCNLNLQWQGYRAKSNEKAIAEVDALSDQYQSLSISFMDNLLPARGLKSLFAGIQKLGKDLRLFAEMRATTPWDILEAMGAAGMHEVQVGIESLSSSLLKKLNKGTTAIDNLEIMKNCESTGLPDLTGNLILNFPSSDEQDVAETVANLEFVLPFRPLKGIPFWLGYGSAVWRIPDAYGIKRVRNHPFYNYLFPPDILRGLRMIIQGYQGNIRYQSHLWQPVKEKLDAWKKHYDEIHQAPGSGPILSYEDGHNFMIIRERRSGTYDMTHRLKGTSRKIYLFCHRQRAMSRILSHFPGLREEQANPFLRMMVDKRLMFNEGDRYLSLAVHKR